MSNEQSNAGFPLRHILSIGVRPAEQRVIQVPEKTTFLTTLPLESACTSIRIGLVNTTDLPFPMDGICVCEADEWAPTGRQDWTYFSFSESDPEQVKHPASGPSSVVVPRCIPHPVTGARDVQIIAWSDWMKFQTRSKDDRPQLQFRTLISTKTAILNFTGLPKPAWRGQPERRREQGSCVGDYVTRPSQKLPEVEQSPYSPIAVIQYRSVDPGLQIVIGGDSHLARPHIFPQLVADQLSTPALPVCVWNTAREARNSNSFWPGLDQAIDLGRPSVAAIQGWTANDGMTSEKDEAYLLRVAESAARTFATGGTPIIIKGMPRQLHGKPAFASWHKVNRKIDTLVDGALTFDPVPIVENPLAPGNWLGKFSDDAIHPNVEANLAMRDPFKQLLLSRKWWSLDGTSPPLG